MSLEALAIPCAIVGLILEGFAANALWGTHGVPDADYFSAMVFHIGALLTGWPAVWRMFPDDYRQHRITMTAMIFGFALPLPILGPLFLLGFRIIIRRPPATFDESEYVVGTNQYLTLPKQADNSLNDESPRSVAQILNSNDKVARRAAILALRVVDPKKAIPLLQKAIQDSDEQVRLLAQTLFNQILATLEAEVKTLESAIVEQPHWNRLLLLAEQYHEIVYLGLASDETETIYLRRSIELLEQAQSMAPENSSIRFLLLKCLLRVGDYEKAKKRLRHLDNVGWRSEIITPWMAEIHFLERDWDSLRTALEPMAKSQNTAPVLRAPIDFWLQPETK
ncbi:MAG: tetratricopeptide (TPR) repeat protein [Limisphaerales bacterium]|jgi:tetratricopeptide (TPR) repeat protein